MKVTGATSTPRDFGTLAIGMRKLVCLAGVLTLGLLGLAADGTTPATKQATPKKGAATAHKQAVSATTGTRAATTRTGTSRTSAATKRGKKGSRRTATTRRSRQLEPTPERYKEIQQALVTKGYLAADEVTGKWTDSSTEALKKFQADQNLDGNGKINSLSLIALGLGPKRDTSTAAPKPASAIP